MARILLAWELGGDYGHLMRFLALAHELVRRGHEPVFALRELTHVDSVMRDEPFPVFQAPVFIAQVNGLPSPIGFAETLMRIGFLHPPALAGICRGWRTLVQTVVPRLLILDYAPTALLATRGLDLPRVRFGASFSMPPRTEPMPTYRWWEQEPTARVIGGERAVLATANAVLARLGEPPMRKLADLLDADDTIIATSEPFDQYPRHTATHYWGAVANRTSGVAPAWPDGKAKRVFAYLKPHFRDFEKLLDALRRVDAAVVVHAPGAAPAIVNKYAAGNMAFSADPVCMDDVCRECDAAICHAGGGTVESVVAAGKPLLLLPLQLEQAMTARRVESMGAGIVVNPGGSADYRHAVTRLLDEPSFTAAARAVALRLASDDPATRVARIAARCEESLARAPANA